MHSTVNKFLRKCFERTTHESEQCPLGVVHGFVGVIEASGRGWLHLHTLLFSPPIAPMRLSITAGTPAGTKVCEVIDSIVETSLGVGEKRRPGTDLRFFEQTDDFKNFVLSGLRMVNAHSHSPVCFKYGAKRCRFCASIPNVSRHGLFRGCFDVVRSEAGKAARSDRAPEALDPSTVTNPNCIDERPIFFQVRRSPQDENASEFNFALASACGCNTNVTSFEL